MGAAWALSGVSHLEMLEPGFELQAVQEREGMLGRWGMSGSRLTRGGGRGLSRSCFADKGACQADGSGVPAHPYRKQASGTPGSLHAKKKPCQFLPNHQQALPWPQDFGDSIWEFMFHNTADLTYIWRLRPGLRPQLSPPLSPAHPPPIARCHKHWPSKLCLPQLSAAWGWNLGTLCSCSLLAPGQSLSGLLCLLFLLLVSC